MFNGFFSCVIYPGIQSVSMFSDAIDTVINYCQIFLVYPCLEVRLSVV